MTKEKPNLARWFWGSIILMAGLSIFLSVAVVINQSVDATAVNPAVTNQDESSLGERTATELSAAELDNLLSEANLKAVNAVIVQIEPLLEEAYQPVYLAIPKYADYHYSVWGEYVELTAAARGLLGVKLGETLFVGFDKRLSSVESKLDNIFSSTFLSSVEDETAELNASNNNLGALTKAALNDAERRMLITIPAGIAAITGTKVLAGIIAKKIAAKLAIKAGAKVSGKLATTATGVGIGAASCAWAGPVAGVCAAAGGIAAWATADYVIVKLDSLWNRADFENDLRTMIDEHKHTVKLEMEKAVKLRALSVQDMSAKVVEQHDFTLRELSGVGNAEICNIATNLSTAYDLMRATLKERNSGAISALREAASEQAGNLSIGRLAQEITQNLTVAEQILVKSIKITGNLPMHQRGDRDVSGRFEINGKTVEIPKISIKEGAGFVIELGGEINLNIKSNLDYRILLEQHRRIWGNRYFGGMGKKKISDVIDTADGLVNVINTTLKISYYESAESLEDIRLTSQEGQLLFVSFELHAKPLTELKAGSICQQD
jgi:hypothetical protein